MILRRTGCKQRIAQNVISCFPEHAVYVELFFGAGGIFFNKPLAKYNFLNDLDDDVLCFYDVIRLYKDEFIFEIERMPIHENLFKRWIKENETDAVMKAIRFIFLSNFSYLGKMDTLQLGCNNPKKMILDRIDATQKMLKDVFFTGCDFREVLRKIALKDEMRPKVFVYADPPYLATTGKAYKVDVWKENDAIDLFKLLANSGFKFAISEFDNPFILDLAKSYGLNITEIKERQNLKNRRAEMLVTNYDLPNKLF